MSDHTIRVLIAEDSAPFRRLIRTVMDVEDDLDVVAEAVDGEEAVALATEHAPQVVLMDVRMPKLDGIAATKVLHELHPNTKVLMLTISDEPSDLFAAIRAGASGYLLKDIDPDEVVHAIRSVQHGEAVLSAAVTPMLMRELASAVAEDPHGGQSRPLVTNRELQVLQQLARGRSPADAGQKLGLSEPVVNHHVHNVLRKFQVHERFQEAMDAASPGVVTSPGAFDPED